MPTIQPFTDEQVQEANEVYGDWWYYYFGGAHRWRVHTEETAKRPELVGKPLFQKPSAKHFLRFINEVVYTLNEDAPDDPFQKFPEHKSYIEYYVKRALFAQRFIVVPKSRRLMMTWINAIYGLWFALANPKRNVVWQAQKGDKVADTMENKILHVMKSLPLDRFAPFVDVNNLLIPTGWDDRVVNFYRGKRESYGLTRLTFLIRDNWLTGGNKLDNGSRILGVPEGADQTRQYTITLFIGDEFGFWKKPKASLKGMRPALGKTGQGILISSASPGYMEELIERPVQEPGTPLPEQPTPYHEGIKTWYSRQGWFVMWTHYTADENKRSVEWTEWPDLNTMVVEGDPGYHRLGYSRRDWLQEFEIDFSIHTGEPFYPEYSDSTHMQPVRAIPNQPLILGFDFGLTPATVIGQITRSGHFNILDELVSDENGIAQHCDILVKYLDQNYPWWKGKAQRKNITDEDFLEENALPAEMVISYVDPAGLQRAQTDMTTPVQIMKQFKLNPVASVQDVVERSEAVKELLSRSIYYPSREIRLPAMLINPRCKTLLNGMRGGAKQGKIRFKKEKNEFSHVVEALEYAAVMLTSVERRLNRRKVRQQQSTPFIQQGVD